MPRRCLFNALDQSHISFWCHIDNAINKVVNRHCVLFTVSEPLSLILISNSRNLPSSSAVFSYCTLTAFSVLSLHSYRDLTLRNPTNVTYLVSVLFELIFADFYSRFQLRFVSFRARHAKHFGHILTTRNYKFFIRFK